MFVVEAETYNPLHDLIIEYIKRDKATPGTNQKQVAINFSAWSGLRNGLEIAIAAILTEKRIQAIDKIVPIDQIGDTRISRMVEAVTAHTTRQWLQGVFDRWHVEGKWKDVSDEDFFEELDREMMEELILPKELADRYEKQRRSMVRTGGLPPRPEDVEWLTQERDAMLSQMTPFDKLIEAAKNSANESNDN